jgi:hypothetical protein
MSSRLENIFKTANKKLIPGNYLTAGIQAISSRDKRYQYLMEEVNRKQPANLKLSIKGRDSNNNLIYLQIFTEKVATRRLG